MVLNSSDSGWMRFTGGTKMQTFTGIAASPGIAIGEALVIDSEGYRVPQDVLAQDAAECEIQRLGNAIQDVACQVEENLKAVTDQLGEDIGSIFAAHLQILRDPQWRKEVEQAIRESQYSAEFAVSQTLQKYAAIIQQAGGGYMAERAHDIYDLERSLLDSLTGKPRAELSAIESPVVILADNLTPNDTARMTNGMVLGFGTEMGGASGHAAIVARGLGIPAVVGIGRFLPQVSGGELVIVDGDQGIVVLSPDEATLNAYQHRASEEKEEASLFVRSASLPAITRDGTTIRLMANIEFPQEAEMCLARGADGVGLYRTEFLYLGQTSEPSEDDHYAAYVEVLRAMDGRPVTIRTLDLGADKMGQVAVDTQLEPNPFLGLRSIRLSLANPQLFKTQLRAILRASAIGHVRVMFPLITTVRELREARRHLDQAALELKEEGQSYDEHISVGMMVESPAAAVMIESFMDDTDFVSIGTNDLVQYTLAVDRTNVRVAPLYQETEPAVLRLMQRVIQTSQQHQVEVGLCGAMSADKTYTMLLLGLGLRELSVPAGDLSEIKQICRELDISQCEAVAERALEMRDALEIKQYLRNEFQKTRQ